MVKCFLIPLGSRTKMSFKVHIKGWFPSSVNRKRSVKNSLFLHLESAPALSRAIFVFQNLIIKVGFAL